MSNTDQANLSFLPPELIRHICRYLNTADILSLEMTDRQQRRLIGESGVWRVVDLRWREHFQKKVNCPHQRKLNCECVIGRMNPGMEQIVDFFRNQGLQEARYFKVALGLISQTKKILLVLDSDRYLPCKEETQAWNTYISVVMPMTAEGKKLIVGPGRKEISDLWVTLNTTLVSLLNRLSWYTLYENRTYCRL
eukprot:GFUD01105698.1.p1 GENE.GFUD01105698.1~~GFUD01105698.1.p1  ORF type:complete len:194 (-),score=4.48 GFUD01105698.1:65-646(-)